MPIIARYPGKCSVCGRPIRAGEQIEWDKADRTTAHARCAGGKALAVQPSKAATPTTPEEIQAAAEAAQARYTRSASPTQGRNRKPGSCERCGEYLAVGAGLLRYCEYDTGCMKHHDESGYHLTCADGGCETRLAEEKAEAETARKAKIENALAALRALTEPVKIWYHDGEYLSGHQVSGDAAKLLEAVGLAHYVSMWGTKVEDRLIKALGTEFTGTQVADYYAAIKG